MEEPISGRQASQSLAVREETDAERKRRERTELLRSTVSYRMVRRLSDVMDRWFIDPILGLVLPGVGDLLTSVMAVPVIYVSLCKIKSVPLTLAVVYNIMVDSLLGMLPFGVGEVIDFFNHSFRKNERLIAGFVENDPLVVREVNRKAVYSAVMIVVCGILIYLLFLLLRFLWRYLAEGGEALFRWAESLF